VTEDEIRWLLGDDSYRLYCEWVLAMQAAHVEETLKGDSAS
jgi:hypothetical protein